MNEIDEMKSNVEYLSRISEKQSQFDRICEILLDLMKDHRTHSLVDPAKLVKKLEGVVEKFYPGEVIPSDEHGVPLDPCHGNNIVSGQWSRPVGPVGPVGEVGEVLLEASALGWESTGGMSVSRSDKMTYSCKSGKLSVRGETLYGQTEGEWSPRFFQC